MVTRFQKEAAREPLGEAEDAAVEARHGAGRQGDDASGSGVTVDRWRGRLQPRSGSDVRAGCAVAAPQECSGCLERLASLVGSSGLQRALGSPEAANPDQVPADPLVAPAGPQVASAEFPGRVQGPPGRGDEVLGAMLRRGGRDCGLGAREIELLRAAGDLLATSRGDPRQGSPLSSQREDLESVYFDRYRELVEANQRLKGINRFKDEVIGACSHDLRGPLNVLLGHARLLSEAELEGQDASSVQVILRQGRRMLDLLEMLLERSCGDEAGLTLDPVKFDLAAACREAAAEHEILGAGQSVGLEVRAPERLEVLADAVMLRQVLQNLVRHALGRAPEGSRVRIVAEPLVRPDGQLAKVTVRDEGAPIGDDLLPALFERHRGRGAAGLGLASCRDFVELHGGEIWAQSGPGTTALHFTLPVADARSPRPVLGDARPRARILLAEDPSGKATNAAGVLGAHYRVEVARDGAEALARARIAPPALILMDVFLPRIDGLDVAAMLQASPDTRDIPVILVASHQGLVDKVRDFDLNAVDFLARPHDPEELLSRVEAALAAGAARRSGEGAVERHPGVSREGRLGRELFLLHFAERLEQARRSSLSLFLLVLIAERPVDASIAGRLRAAVRTGDCLVDLEDGRFAACLSDVTPVAAQAVAGRLVALIENASGAKVRVELVDAAGSEAGAEALLRIGLGEQPKSSQAAGPE